MLTFLMPLLSVPSFLAPAAQPAPCTRADFQAPAAFRFLEGEWEGKVRDVSKSDSLSVERSFKQRYGISKDRYESTADFVDADGNRKQMTLGGFFACDGTLVLDQGLPPGASAFGYASRNRIVFEANFGGRSFVEMLSLAGRGFVTSSEQSDLGATKKFGSMHRVSADPGVDLEPAAGALTPPFKVERCMEPGFVAPAELREYTGRWAGGISTFDARTGALLREGRTSGNTVIEGSGYHLDYTFNLPGAQPVTYSNGGVFACDGLLGFENFALTGVSWGQKSHVFQERVSNANTADVSYDLIALRPDGQTLRTTHRTQKGELVEVLFMQESKIK